MGWEFWECLRNIPCPHSRRAELLPERAGAAGAAPRGQPGHGSGAAVTAGEPGKTLEFCPGTPGIPGRDSREENPGRKSGNRSLSFPLFPQVLEGEAPELSPLPNSAQDSNQTSGIRDFLGKEKRQKKKTNPDFSRFFFPDFFSRFFPTSFPTFFPPSRARGGSPGIAGGDSRRDPATLQGAGMAGAAGVGNSGAGESRDRLLPPPPRFIYFSFPFFCCCFFPGGFWFLWEFFPVFFGFFSPRLYLSPAAEFPGKRGGGKGEREELEFLGRPKLPRKIRDAPAIPTLGGGGGNSQPGIPGESQGVAFLS